MRVLKEKRIKENYKDFDASTISAYVKSFINHVKEPESIDDFIDNLNEYLQPLNTEVFDCYENVRWQTEYIAYGQSDSNGYIQIGINGEFILQNLKYDFEEGDIEKDYEFLQFLKDLGQVIVHEMVHQYQFSKHSYRKDVVDPEEGGMWDYLKSKDEIAAHAIAGIQEAFDLNWDVNSLIDAIKDSERFSDLVLELNSTKDYYDYIDRPESSEEKKVRRLLQKSMMTEVLNRLEESTFLKSRKLQEDNPKAYTKALIKLLKTSTKDVEKHKDYNFKDFNKKRKSIDSKMVYTGTSNTIQNSDELYKEIIKVMKSENFNYEPYAQTIKDACADWFDN